MTWKDQWGAETLRLYVPTVGDEAARYQRRSNFMHIYFSTTMAMSVVLAVPLALAGLKLAAWVCFVPLFAIAMASMLGRFWFRHRYFQSASRALGVRVNFLRPVDVRPERYEQWCARNDISPLAERPSATPPS